MASPANVRVSAQFPFPALAVGAAPITLTKSNGVYTIGLNVSGLAIQTPPAGSYPTDFLLVYDSTTKTFFQMPLSFVGIAQLVAATTFYVDTNSGNDNGTGLAPGAGAFKTIQGAINKIASSYNLNNQAVTLQVGVVGGPPQTFNENVVIPPLIGGSNFTIQGDAAAPANVVMASAAGNTLTVGSSGGQPVAVSIKGVTVTSAAGTGFQVMDGCRIVIVGQMTFGACALNHMAAFRGGGILVRSPYNVSGGSGAHVNLIQDSSYSNSGANQITITANIAVTNWLNLGRISNAVVVGQTFSLGAFTVTGARFNSNANSVIDTGGGGANFLPGTIAGALAQSGAQYL